MQTVVDGSAEKVSALLSGQVDFANGAIGGVLPAVESGQLRALAIDTVVEVRFGLIMSAEVDPEVRQTLEDALKRITENPEFIEKMAGYGNDTVFLTGAEFSVVWDEMGDTLTGLDFSTLN